jgi:predicted TIM-barrel fold metal-dependent hydrolase
MPIPRASSPRRASNGSTSSASVIEFASADPQRLIPVASLPFWDVEASLKELERCVDGGHRAALWAARFNEVGLPYFSDSHWDPIYAAAQEMGVPMQMHVGFAAITASTKPMPELLDRDLYEATRFAKQAGTSFVRQVDTIAEIVMSGLCERFPRLDFVSVESGFGFIPFLMEMLDWQWQNFAGPAPRPDLLLPSEYFQRQVHATFWFERQTLPALEYYAENIMFSTDFPHPTSLTPGPSSVARRPDLHIADAITSRLPEPLARRVLSENAARLYRIPVSA